VARPEPFRALLEKALQSDVRPVIRQVPARRAMSTTSAPSTSPALALDDEHKRTTLEQRLDAVVLAAGATPPHAMRPPKLASPSLVPLRIDRPVARAVATLDERTGPAPRMLQFLIDEARAGSAVDDSVSAIPRLEPVQDSSKIPVAVGVATNVYRLGSMIDDEAPTRPLPVLGSSDDEVETRKLRRVEKVLTLKTLDHLDVRLSAFTSSDTDSDIIEIVGDIRSDLDRAPHSAAALALPVLSEEGLDTITDFADELGGDLDELARQLGLEGMVPRTTPPTRADDSLDGELFVDADDIEIVAVTTPTNPMRAMVVSRPVVPVDAVDALEGDDEGDDGEGFAWMPTPPSGSQRLPSSLLQGLDDTGFDDEDTVTPAHGTMRPSLQAPSAVRFVVAEAPARPRKAALRADEVVRNRARAHDLYLVALDDIACRDTQSAVVHLELALAYDDETPLYHDLLSQLQRKLAQKQPDTEQ
jgi:hypothetical protein